MVWKKLWIPAVLWIGTLALSHSANGQTHRASSLYQDLSFLLQEEQLQDGELLEYFYYKPHENRSWFHKALLWRPFVSIEKDGWQINFNPTYQILSSSENDAGGFYVNARGLFIQGSLGETFGFTTSVYECQTNPIYLVGSDFEPHKVYPGIGKMKLRNPIDIPFFQGEWCWQLSKSIQVVSGYGKMHPKGQQLSSIWSREVAAAFYAGAKIGVGRLDADLRLYRAISQNAVGNVIEDGDTFHPGSWGSLAFVDYWLLENKVLGLTVQSRFTNFSKEDAVGFNDQQLIGAKSKWKGFEAFGLLGVNKDANSYHVGVWKAIANRALLKLELFNSDFTTQEYIGVHYGDRPNPNYQRTTNLIYFGSRVFYKRWELSGDVYGTDKGANSGLVVNGQLAWTINASNFSQLFISTYENPFVLKSNRVREIRFGFSTQLFPQTWR